MTTKNETLYLEKIDSPVGALGIAVDDGGHLIRIDFLGRDARRADEHWQDTLSALADDGPFVMGSERTVPVVAQLREYFAGRRRTFDLEVAPRGTDFQRRVWRQLQEIPFGETRSYGDLASALGRPGAARAVGRANATNPIPIVIPCHRVIGHDGSLTGFGGGLDAKRALLDLEAPMA